MQIPHSEAFFALQQYQDSLLAEGIAGNDVAVFRAGLPIYRHMAGYRDLAARLPITQDTLYRMYSMTKPITAAAAMRLWEKGAFRLDEPISERMPAFSDMRVIASLYGSTSVCTTASPLRVIDLLTMTAGFDYNIESPRLSALYKATAGQHTTQDIADVLAKQELSFVPGTRWQYSLAFDVLAAFLEVVSGVSFGTLLRQSIFEPLHMSSARYCHGEDDPFLCKAYRFDHRRGYVRGPGPSRMLRSPFFEGGGAGLIMTVQDYAKFACMLTECGVTVDGVRILQKDTVALMTENHLRGRPLADFIASPMGRPGYGYGFGVRTLVDPNEAHSPEGKGAFGWGGALGTFVLMDPLYRLTFVYAQQRPGRWDEKIPLKIRDLIYQALPTF